MSDPRSLPEPTHQVPSARLPGWALVVVAAAAGIAAGVLEVVVAVVRRGVGGKLWVFGPELIWLVPLGDGTLFLGLGLLFLLASRVIRPLRRRDVVVTCFAGLAAFSVLSLFDQLHPVAALVLALGIGRATGRGLERLGMLERHASRLVLAAAILCLTAGLGQGLWERWSERRQAAQGSIPLGDHPSILLLVLDTVRAWNLGWHGYQRATTPHLDRRWRSGVVFERALATAPWTLPSHASMFTGHSPVDLSASWDRPLDASVPTLAEVLGDAGYATGGFVGNYRYAGGSSGLDRGFGRYDDYPWSVAETVRMLSLTRRVLRIPAVQQWLGERRVLEARPAESVNGAFLRWVDRHPDRPFFAFLNYVDAHSPYLPPSPYDSQWVTSDPKQISRRFAAGVERVFGRGPVPGQLLAEYLDGYDGALSYLDVQIDSLLEQLNRRGRLENTVVILTADHGEHFGEHGLIQHGNSLYLPLLHVPLAIWAPGRVPRGLRLASPVSLGNLAATVVDLAGLPASGIPGHSLALRWGGDSTRTGPDTLLSAVDWHRTLSRFPPSSLLAGSLRSVVLDSLHYIRRADGAEELYDLGRDFLEARNLVGNPGYAGGLAAARGALDAATGGRRGPAP